MNRWARRDVLRSFIRLPLLAGATALLAACGGDGGGSSSGYGSSKSSNTGGSTAPAACDGIVPTMDLHTHPTCLTMAELQGGNLVTLTMEAGTTGHTHTVTLAAADVQMLRDTANSVTVTSSPTGHTHQVTFT